MTAAGALFISTLLTKIQVSAILDLSAVDPNLKRTKIKEVADGIVYGVK